MTRRIVWPYHILMVIYVAAVAWLCFSRFEAFPNIGRTIFGMPTDKVVHFCMFFPFPILAFLAFDRFTNNIWASLTFGFCTLVVGVLLAMGTEWGQATLTDYRSGDRMDLLADCIALFLSTVLVTVWDIVKQYRPCEKSSS